MAGHRMFSNRVGNSARFLQMPEGSQLLFFHMVLRADDDGVVETYPIMKLLGSAPDSLKVLYAKGFIKQLNEDQVAIIIEWKEHNKIRADRKVNSIYAHLIKEKCPELELINPKPRSDVEDNSRRTDNGQSTDGISKVKLSQVKLRKDRLIPYTKKDKFLTDLLYKLVKQNYLFLKEKDYSKDYAEMNKLHRIDKWTYEQIEYIIKWSQRDEFWKQNIRSVKKLRIKFEELVVRAKGQNQKGGVIKT